VRLLLQLLSSCGAEPLHRLQAVGERSIHRVQIALANETVPIPWESRQALLVELRRRELREVADAFEAVGTSRPVTLTPEQKAEFREAIRLWAEQVEDGYAGLPEGIKGLRLALACEPENA
jgi:hypothetical protein